MSSRKRQKERDKKVEDFRRALNLLKKKSHSGTENYNTHQK